jgi:uncharacterized membrane protein YidH (DUF202 family)
VALSLRNPETQAKLSGILICGALVILMVALALGFQSFRADMRSFVYKADGKRMPIVFAASLLSLLMAAGAFWFSYASAGERRNSYSRLSWICFGASGLTIVIALVFMAAYRFMGWAVN